MSSANHHKAKACYMPCSMATPHNGNAIVLLIALRSRANQALRVGAQGAKADAASWNSFLASLQASQSPEETSSQQLTDNWAGTVYWNNIWEKSVAAEAEEVEKKQKAALEAATTGPVHTPEPAAVLAGEAASHIPN